MQIINPPITWPLTTTGDMGFRPDGAATDVLTLTASQVVQHVNTRYAGTTLTIDDGTGNNNSMVFTGGIHNTIALGAGATDLTFTGAMLFGSSGTAFQTSLSVKSVLAGGGSNLVFTASNNTPQISVSGTATSLNILSASGGALEFLTNNIQMFVPNATHAPAGAVLTLLDAGASLTNQNGFQLSGASSGAISMSPYTANGQANVGINIATIGTASVAISAPLNMASHPINGVTDPVAAQDAATKNYVDTGVTTLTNKRLTRRTTTVASSATPTVNTDNTDVAVLAALAVAVTSFTTNLSGTPAGDGDILVYKITDNGTARALTWGASFESSTVALPTTTVISTLLTVTLQWNTVTSKWRCIGVA